jgi:dienelactone hydrolase
MLLGGADDIAASALCNAVTNGIAPGKVNTITYPSARHGFDIRGLPDSKVPGAPVYDPDGAAASWAAVMEFLR